MDDRATVPPLAQLFSLAGRTVVVTGAGKGIGRSIALAVAEAGARVVAVSRTAADLEAVSALVPQGRIVPLAWDIAAVDRADELVARANELAGPLDSVVHAAGITIRGPAERLTPAQWSSVTTVDLDAPFFLSTALYRANASAASVHLFIGSLSTSIGLKGIAPYAASKSGIAGVVRTLALEWAETGSRVNCLAPGYFRTEMTAEKFADTDWVNWVTSRIPMNRVGRLTDLAGPAVFLLSSASAYITGQVINVDGGWLAG
jgi:NAD(P)-dependent dehydrogenase (short-subunit alcohol dehydrogenase family)